MGWLSGWGYRKSHVINSAVNAGANYQVKIKCYFSLIPPEGEDYERYGSNPFSLAGESTGYGVVHPSVLYFPDGEDGYKYWMYYEKGITPTDCDVYLERSNDGLNWTDTGISNPIVASHPTIGTHLPDPDVIKVGTTWYMYLSGDSSGESGLTDGIYLYTSSNGKTWSSYSNSAVLTKSGVDHESTSIACATLYYDETKFYMWYSGYDGATWRLCLAESTNGTNWDKSPSNPLLDDVLNVGVAKYGDVYYLAFNRDSPVEIGMATSSNKTFWTENPNNPVLECSGVGWESDYLYRASWLRTQYGVGVIFDYNKMLYYSAFGGTYYNIGLAYVALPANIVNLENHSRTDFGDVRFTEDDGVTPLDYWMESKVNSDYAIFWIEVADDLSSVNQTIYIYYGNDGATTTSNGDDAFEFFDDFLGTSIDAAKWDTIDAGMTYSVSDSKLIITACPTQWGTYYGFHSSWTPKQNSFAIEAISMYYDDGSAVARMFRFAVLVGDASNWYKPCMLMVFDSYNTKHPVIYFNHEVAGAPEYIGSELGATAEKDFELTVNQSSSCNYYEDEALRLGPQTRTTTIAELMLLVQKHADYNFADEISIDCIFVRKFVSPEPAHAAWGQEEEVELPSSKVFILDKENNLFRVDPTTLAEEKTLDVS